MATNTYVALDKVTVGTATPSITFTSIPQGYTDLVLVMSAATTHTLSTFPMVQFNGDTGSNYSVTELYGTGSAAGSARDTNTTSGWIGFDISISNTVGEHTAIANFMNYSNSTTYKTWLSRANRASSALDYQGTDAVVGLWRSTAAITSMTIKNRRGGVDYNFAVGSTFSLYGIKADTNSTPKATGGFVSSDATYWYHTFAMSGTFTPNQTLSCDILTIAGGGAGGRGGGGAGGLVYLASQSIAASAQTITIGGGGAQRATDGGGLSNPGSNSQFASLTAAVGGGAAAGYNVNGGNGGSGGGAGWGGGGGYSGGTATSGQGSNGGGNGNGDGAGGGGGAGGAGATGATGAPGVGGVGSSTYSSWGLATNTGQLVSGTYYYAGGGGGSANTSAPDAAGGYGGGGSGRSSSGSTPSAGLANTGAGGGGGSGSTAIPGAAGGSGIVIVRYAK